MEDVRTAGNFVKRILQLGDDLGDLVYARLGILFDLVEDFNKSRDECYWTLAGGQQIFDEFAQVLSSDLVSKIVDERHPDQFFGNKLPVSILVVLVKIHDVLPDILAEWRQFWQNHLQVFLSSRSSLFCQIF